MAHYRSLVLGLLGASSAAWLAVGCSSSDNGSVFGEGGSTGAIAGAMNVGGTPIGSGAGSGGVTANGGGGASYGGASGAAQGGVSNGGASGAAQGGSAGSFTGGSANGGTAGSPHGGSANGGSSSGGSAGSANGGSANGGSANGGSANGGSAGSAGGSSSGGSTGCVPDYKCKPVAPNTGDAEADCVARVNQFRACVCLPPLSADPPGDSCSNQEAKYDADHNAAHAGIGAKICTPGFFAENECPAWPSIQSTIDGCSQQMFNEGPPPTPKCSGSCYSAHGHFINMTGNYQSVSCGFFTTADGKVWTVQNFR